MSNVVFQVHVNLAPGKNIEVIGCEKYLVVNLKLRASKPKGDGTFGME